MEIIFHGHNAEISSLLRKRAELGVRKLERRIGRATAAVLRFATDGPARRVEIVLEASRGRRYVAEARARHFGTAIGEALHRLNAQLEYVERAKPRPRRSADT